jgi:short-subunit dehydrogenase
LARKGVHILTAKPGYVRTELIEGRELPSFVPVISAERAASEILRAAAAGKRVVYIPGWWRPVMFAVRMIPRPVFERISL